MTVTPFGCMVMKMKCMKMIILSDVVVDCVLFHKFQCLLYGVIAIDLIGTLAVTLSRNINCDRGLFSHYM